MSLVSKTSQRYSGFAPNNIPYCTLWLDAADPATLSLSGSVVTQWRDKSGNGRHTTTIGGSPVFSSNSILLDGSSTYLVGSYAVNTVSWTAFVVGTVNYAGGVSTAAYRLLSIGSTTANDYNINNYGSILRQASASNVGVLRNNISVYTPVTTNTPFIFVTQQDGTNMSLFLDGATKTSVARTGGQYIPLAYSIGRNVGSTDGTAPNFGYAYWPGSVSEVILYTTLLTSSQRQLVEGYLARKWGRLSILPTAHLYKTISPYNRPFSPRDVPGCLVWFDAADISTITGTSPVTNWVNKGEAGGSAVNNSTQVCTSGNRVNGLNYINCPRNCELRFTATLNTQSRSWFIVSRIATPLTSALVQSFILLFGVVSGDNQIMITYVNTTSNKFQLASASISRLLVDFVNASITNNVFLLTAINNSVSDTANPNRVLFNGTVQTLSASNLATGYPTTSTTYRIGASDRNISLDVMEMIMYSSALGGNDDRSRALVEGYLAQKWGIQTLLPASHSFSLYPSLSPVFAPFIPTTCSIWLDASDSLSLTLSGTTVTQWRDKSGNARNPSLFGGPTYSTTAPYPYVATRNLNQYLTIPATAYQTTSGVVGYIFFVYADTKTQGTNNAMLYATADPFNYFSQSLQRSDSQPYWISSTNTPSSITTVLNTTNIVLYCLRYQHGFTGFTLRLYGSDMSLTTAAGAIAPAGALFISAAGWAPTSGTAANLNLCEIIAFTRLNLFSTTELHQIEGYLAWKWKIQDKLPSTHLYKNISP